MSRSKSIATPIAATSRPPTRLTARPWRTQRPEQGRRPVVQDAQDEERDAQAEGVADEQDAAPDGRRPRWPPGSGFRPGSCRCRASSRPRRSRPSPNVASQALSRAGQPRAEAIAERALRAGPTIGIGRLELAADATVGRWTWPATTRPPARSGCQRPLEAADRQDPGQVQAHHDQDEAADLAQRRAGSRPSAPPAIGGRHAQDREHEPEAGDVGDGVVEGHPARRPGRPLAAHRRPRRPRPGRRPG